MREFNQREQCRVAPALEIGNVKRCAGAVDFARMAQVLREHWLTGLECDHEAKTDVANCFCGRWRPAPEPSVGQAVERWVEHVMEQVRRGGDANA